MKKLCCAFLLALVLASSAYARYFASIEAAYGRNSGSTKRISTGSYGYYEDIAGPKSDTCAPFTFSIGFLKEKSFGDGVGVSLFFTKNIGSEIGITTENMGYDFSKESLPSELKAQATSQQVGVGFVYRPNENIGVNVGISKDIGSKIVYPIKNEQIERKLNGVYMPISFELSALFDDILISMTSGTQMHLSGDEYLATSFFIGLKLQHLFSW